MKDTALILEGGGMRGVYTCGVLDALMEEGLFFPAVYGVSAGVCHASSYLSRQKGRAYRTVADYSHDRRYGSFRSLFSTGDYFGVDMVYREIPDTLLPFDYDTFAAKEETLFAGLTHCLTGEAAYLPVRDLRTEMDIIRASSSLPLLSKMVTIDGVPYLDGGISDSIPLARSIADGHQKNVIVLTQHGGYRKGPTSTMPAVRLFYRKYPALVEAVRTRHQRYNKALDLVDSLRDSGRAVVIQPAQKVEIGRLEKDKEKLDALYRQGLADGSAAIPAIRAMLT